MTNTLVDTLQWQFRMTWSLARDHWLPALSDDLLLWKQAANAATMRKAANGEWRPDWDDDTSPVPPATAGWLTWHITWWWTSIAASMGGSPIPGREFVAWEPNADVVRDGLEQLADGWMKRLAALTDEVLQQPFSFPWPEPRPGRFAVAWVNSELMKNTAELGDVIRLYNGRAA